MVFEAGNSINTIEKVIHFMLDAPINLLQNPNLADRNESDAEIMNEISREQSLELWLLNINETEFFFYENLITESDLLDDLDGIATLVSKLFEAAIIRPNNIELYLKLISDLSDQEPEFQKAVVKEAMKMHPNNAFFSYKIISKFPDQIQKLLKSYISDQVIMWFAPELLKVNRGAFERKMIGFQSRAADNALVKSFVESLGEMNEEQLDEYKEKREIGMNENPIALAIRFDNLEELQRLISQMPKDDDFRIEPSFFERCDFVNHKPTLIQFAAFFRAKKCFKFLLMNDNKKENPENQNLDLEEVSLMQFAVAGGDSEIVKLSFLKEKKIIGCEQIAETFKRDAVLQWLQFIDETEC